VSVLCPAYVPTSISDSERNRPAALRNSQRSRSAEDLEREEQLRHAVQSGKVSAENVADLVLQSMIDEKFYVLTHPRIKAAIQMRLEDILNERDPTDTSKPRR
jgi:hypothetical protein